MNSRIALWIGLGVLALAVALGATSYNGMNGAKLDANEQTARYASALQGQADVIPNIVATVKGYAGHENNTLREVTEARGQVASVSRVDVTKLNDNPALQDKIINAQAQMNQTMAKLNSVVEKYPDLKADKQFMNLQVKLDNENNRVRTERGRLQGLITVYNRKVTSFPNSMFAGLFGFRPMSYFDADEEAKKAPKVSF